MRASIVVVNYNGGPEAPAAVAELAAHAIGADAELIVVDNCSDDGSDGLIERDVFGARLLREPANRGYATAVGRGLAEASGDALVVMNADVRPVEGAVGALIDVVLEDPGRGLVGGLLLGRRGRVTADTARPLPIVSDILREGFFLPGRRTASRHEVLRRRGRPGTVPAPAVSGAVMGLGRETLKLLGPMDADYFLYNEDVEWCRRAGREGLGVAVATGAVFEHAGGASTRKSERAAFAARVLSDFVYFTEGEGVPADVVRARWLTRLRFRANLYGTDARCGILGGRSSSADRAAIYRELERRLRAFDWTPAPEGQSGHPDRLLRDG